MTTTKTASDNFTLARVLARRLRRLDASEKSDLETAHERIAARYSAKRTKLYDEAGPAVTRLAAAAIEAEIGDDLELDDVDVDVTDGGAS